MPDISTLIAGHRGAKGLAPENTIEAFEAAIKLGAEMVEFDVRRTADGALVVHHDAEIAGEKICGLSCDRLREISTDGPPTLAEALGVCAGRIAVDIEIKEAGCESGVLEMVAAHADRSEVIITSFIDDVVARIKQIDPSIRTGLLVGMRLPNPLYARVFGPFPFRRCARVGADVVVAHYELLRFGFLKRARRRGLPVYVWTVNDEAKIAQLVESGVDAIITDYPDRALRVRQGIQR